jgi:hypothetical protein
MTPAKSGRRRVEEVFVKRIEKTGFPGFGFSRQGDKLALGDRRRLPEERMQLAGSKDGGSVYTEWDLGSPKWKSRFRPALWTFSAGIDN